MSAPRALLLGYGLQQPSFRHRMNNLALALESAGWEVKREQFPSGRYGLRTFERRDLLRWADVSILHQIKLSTAEARLFARYARRRIFDVDDAIYVRKPRRLGDPVGDSRWRRKKFAATCRLAQIVVTGNEVLARVARAANPRVEILPTSVDITRYVPAAQAPAAAITVAWIGSPENLVYLELMHAAFTRLSARYPNLVLRVICSEFPNWPDARIERVNWSSATEAQDLTSANIGIMPLSDDEWGRGKCAFKLLQYMAAALPCVASPVGANTEAVIHGLTGFHARDDAQWEQALEKLILSVELRRKLGAAGRARVEERYATNVYARRYRELLASFVAED